MEGKTDMDRANNDGALRQSRDGRAPWTTPGLVRSEVTSATQQKLSSTVELYVVTFQRDLGPS